VLECERIALQRRCLRLSRLDARLELGDARLRHAEVASIQDLAAKLRRDYKNTYDDLAALKAWGLVAVLREGKNQRPVSHVTSLRVSWEK